MTPPDALAALRESVEARMRAATERLERAERSGDAEAFLRAIADTDGAIDAARRELRADHAQALQLGDPDLAEYIAEFLGE